MNTKQYSEKLSLGVRVCFKRAVAAHFNAKCHTMTVHQPKEINNFAEFKAQAPKSPSDHFFIFCVMPIAMSWWFELCIMFDCNGSSRYH